MKTFRWQFYIELIRLNSSPWLFYSIKNLHELLQYASDDVIYVFLAGGWPGGKLIILAAILRQAFDYHGMISNSLCYSVMFEHELECMSLLCRLSSSILFTRQAFVIYLYRKMKKSSK
jgi:hypothetical protein